jgi:hypothetical protein
MRVLKVFIRKRDGVTSNWRGIHNEELHGLYSSTIVGWAK